MLRFSPLYPLLDVDAAAARGFAPEDVFAAWIDAGVTLVQLRAKTWGSGRFLALADDLAARARAAGVTIVVNDRADIARLAGAHGVHVGQTDLAPADARRLVGADAIVGLSTHRDEQVRAALDQPIDYLAIGPVFGTSSKTQPDPEVGLDGVARAVRLAAARALPVVAIGGITLDRAPEVIAAGAASVAVIADLLTGDPGARARAFLARLAS